MTELAPLDSDNDKNLEEQIESFEWALFQIKKELRDKSHVPKLIDARIKKLQALKLTEDIILSAKTTKRTNNHISFERVCPFDDFLKFEGIKSILFQQLNAAQQVSQVIWIAEDLKNLQLQWAKCWEQFSRKNFNESETKISTPPDSMLLHHEFKVMSNQNITTYEQFESVQLPHCLQQEINRLKMLL